MFNKIKYLAATAAICWTLSSVTANAAVLVAPARVVLTPEEFCMQEWYSDYTNCIDGAVVVGSPYYTRYRSWYGHHPHYHQRHRDWGHHHHRGFHTMGGEHRRHDGNHDRRDRDGDGRRDRDGGGRHGGPHRNR